MARGAIVSIKNSKNYIFRTVYIRSEQRQIWDDFVSILIAKGHTDSKGIPKVSFIVLKLIEKYNEANFNLLKIKEDKEDAQTIDITDKD